MNNTLKKTYTTLLAGSLLTAMAGATQAASVTFAQFTEGASDGNAFQYTDTAHGVGGTGTLTNIAGGIDTTFTFQNALKGLGGGFSLNTGYDATLFITATISSNSLDHITNDLDGLTFKFVAGAGTPNPGKILLQGTAGTMTPGGSAFGGTLFAQQLLSSAVSNGSNLPGQSSTATQFVKFNSDVLDTSGLTEENYAFSFTSIFDTIVNSAGAHYTSMGLFGPFVLDSFQAAGTGTFAATSPVPEPGSMALAVGALLSFGGLRLRRRK